MTAPSAAQMENQENADRDTGYADSGERYHCRDCGATGDVDDTAPVLVMPPQPMRKPMTTARVSAELPDVE